jgi:ectoine hydrolase
MRKCDLVAEIYDAGTRGVDGIGGDYPAIVPLLPPGVDASAPHLTWDDRPMRRARAPSSRSPAATSAITAAVAHGLPRQADAGLPRCRKGDAGRHGGRSCRGKTGQHLRGHRQRLLRRAEEIRHRQGQPHRLPDRPVLSAGLGRAHHEPAPGDRTELKPGMTFHFMTGLWLEDMGLEITESILITETGVECLPTCRASCSSRIEPMMSLACARRRSARRSISRPRASSTVSCGCPIAATIPPGVR